MGFKNQVKYPSGSSAIEIKFALILGKAEGNVGTGKKAVPIRALVQMQN